MFNQGIPVITGRLRKTLQTLAFLSYLRVAPACDGRGWWWCQWCWEELLEIWCYESSVTACYEDQPISTYGPNSCFSLGSTLDVCKTRWIMTTARVQVLVGLLVVFLSVTLSDCELKNAWWNSSMFSSTCSNCFWWLVPDGILSLHAIQFNDIQRGLPEDSVYWKLGIWECAQL
jgi:hypothetical protein